jgi:bifunctional DNA primase/polymerase-like protein/AAA domain-containing protein
MMPAPVLGPIGDLGAHALIYAAAGLCVFPLHPDKTPRTTNGMKDATTNPDTIAAWWDRWPDALIGCRIPIDIVVIDVDPKHSGMATWKALKETYGKLPATRTHQSGRNDGGGHLWFHRPHGKLSVRRLNRWAKEHGTGEAAGKHSWVAGIDLLHHNHRYTVLPPSPHPATGAPYRWVEHRDLDTTPADPPAWLAELITEDPTPLPPAPRIISSDVDSIADWFTQTASWSDLLIPEGWTLAGGHGDDDGTRWRHPNATSPWSATVKNGCLFVYSPNTDFDVTSEGDPHGYTRFRALATLAHQGDMTAAARHARYLRDGTPIANSTRDDDWGWTGLTGGVGHQDPDDQTDGAQTEPTGIIPIYWPDFWKREHTAEAWLVEPIVPRGRQVALWATHKTGKSLITLEVAAALATGRPCLGNSAKFPIDVIYLDFEMTEDDLHERLDCLGYGSDSDLDRLHYYLLPALPPLDSPPGAATLLDLVDHHHATLVVIDTMARVVAGEENSADTYRAFYRYTGTRLKAQNVSLLRLDHAGKNADQGQRGSSAKGDDVDLVWQLVATDDGLELRRHASRISWIPPKVALRRHDEIDDLHHTIHLVGAWPAGTRDMADQLDELNVPLSATRREARLALTANQRTATNEILGAALKYRRQRPPEGLIQK